MISPADIGVESIVITFGSGTSGEYPLPPFRVKIDGEEYCLKDAIVQNLASEVLLGRDVPLQKHIVKRLPKWEQMDLLHHLARENEVQLEERPEDKKALAVVTHAEERRMAQQRELPVWTLS